MVMVLPIFIPLIILDLLSFGKEVFIIPLTFFLFWMTKKTSSRAVMFCTIVAVYLVYGIYFRQYYLIILAVFVYCVLITQSKVVFRPIYIALLLAGASRGSVPRLRRSSGASRSNPITPPNPRLEPESRTSIYNPYPPNTWYYFLANYFYTILRLNVPILFMISGSDIVLFLNVIIYGRLLAWIGMRRKPADPASFLPWMFLSHVIVLWIFGAGFKSSYLTPISAASSCISSRRCGLPKSVTLRS